MSQSDSRRPPAPYVTMLAKVDAAGQVVRFACGACGGTVYGNVCPHCGASLRGRKVVAA